LSQKSILTVKREKRGKRKHPAREIYNSSDVVSNYCSHPDLTAGEIAVREILRDKLERMDMLDVGVGGGRTVPHFAPLVRSYTGIDIAEAMIDACRERFPDYRFVVSDALDLSQYGDGSFDFIFFSFNGIDHLDHDARSRALRGFKRLLRPGGYLAYSSHNIHRLPERVDKFRLRISRHPWRLLRSVGNYLRFRNRNRWHSFSSELPWALFYDPAGLIGKYDTLIYYARPDAEVGVLSEMGLENVRVFPDDSGREAMGIEEIAAVTDRWVYYLGRKKSE